MKTWLPLPVVVLTLSLGSCGTFDRSASEGGPTPADVSTTATSGSMSPSAAPPSSTTSSPTVSGSAAQEPGTPRIETFSDSYFGLPYETIQIPGRYVGVQRATTLRVSVHQRDTWQTYPLPVVTSATGDFRVYVELGPGEYLLRVVDPASGVRSEEVTVTVF